MKRWGGRLGLTKILAGTWLTGAIAYASVCHYLASKQREFIFNPSPIIQTHPDQDPINLSYKSVQIPIQATSAKIHGWWIPHAKSSPRQSLEAQKQAKEKRIILYLGGRQGNRSYNLERVKGFHQLGFNVLMVDYRGYGDSDYQPPSEASVYQDSQAAWQYLTQTQNIPPEQILIYGESLGGAIALDLAVRQPNAGGLILQSTFTSMEAMADQISWSRLLPVNALLTERFDSLSKIKSLRVPLLLLHGKADDIVPYQMSQSLYRAAPVPKKLVLVPNGTHYQLHTPGPHSYLSAIAKFISTFPKKSRPHRQRYS